MKRLIFISFLIFFMLIIGQNLGWAAITSSADSLLIDVAKADSYTSLSNADQFNRPKYSADGTHIVFNDKDTDDLVKIVTSSGDEPTDSVYLEVNNLTGGFRDPVWWRGTVFSAPQLLGHQAGGSSILYRVKLVSPVGIYDATSPQYTGVAGNYYNSGRRGLAANKTNNAKEVVVVDDSYHRLVELKIENNASYSARTLASNTNMYYSAPSYSWDGKWLSFIFSVSSTSGNTYLCLMDLSNLTVKTLVNNTSLQVRDSRFSPDNKWLYFVTDSDDKIRRLKISKATNTPYDGEIVDSSITVYKYFDISPDSTSSNIIMCYTGSFYSKMRELQVSIALPKVVNSTYPDNARLSSISSVTLQFGSAVWTNIANVSNNIVVYSNNVRTSVSYSFTGLNASGSGGATNIAITFSTITSGTCKIVISTGLEDIELDTPSVEQTFTYYIGNFPPAAELVNMIQNTTGTSDAISGGAWAVVPGATVQVYADSGLNTLINSTVAGSDGSFGSMTVGDNLYQYLYIVSSNAGNVSGYIVKTNDIIGPVTGVVADGGTTDIDEQTSTNQLIGAWGSFYDALSSIDKYLVSAGTTAGATNVAGWTNVGNVTTHTFSGLKLDRGVTYYFNVKAVDIYGNVSAVASSDGVKIKEVSEETVTGTLANAIAGPTPSNISVAPVKFQGLVGQTTIYIYNIKGYLVRTIENNSIVSECEWDGKNDNGDEVSSGIYIYVITNDKGEVKKGKLAIYR